MKTKSVIALTETERKHARTVVNNKTTSKTFKKRAQRILAIDTNIGQPESQGKIAKRVGRSLTQSGSFATQDSKQCVAVQNTSEPNNNPAVNGEIEARIIATVLRHST
jgi:hypothetical protein